jgi:hypothetical protein
MKSFLPVILLFPLFAIASPGKTHTISANPPINGKLLFSTMPFTTSSSGSKTNFTSNEFIYARLEVPGTIKEAFKLQETYGHYYLDVDVEVWKGENSMGSSNHNYMLVNANTLDKNWFNFDIMPDPTRASTLYSMTEEFDAGLGFFPFYNVIDQRNFPSAGEYKIKVNVFSRSKNAWGKQDEMENWPMITEEFTFNFREEDIAAIQKNSKSAIDRMDKNIATANRYDKLPPVFSNPGKLNDPNASTAKVAAILKRDLPQRAIIRFVAEQYSGAQWSIAKDEYGLPTYRYFNPHIWMIYKAGGDCFVGFVTLRQDYSGGGTYGQLRVAWTTTKDDRGIDCTKLK